MDKELKRLLIEIISLTLLLVIIIPICVSASDKYNEQKEAFFTKTGVNIDISNNGDKKKVTIYSNYDKNIKINLVMKINKFSNDYEVILDNEVYNIDDFEYTEDEENRYYKLGIYDVNQYREFDFKLKPKDTIYYDETIIYSFMTEGLL